MQNKESKGLRFLYNTIPGRLILKIPKARWVSRIVGRYMDSRLSKHMIKKFVRKNNINLDDYYSDNFRCFNDCFTRKIKEDRRPIDMDKNHFISPCDGLLSVYKIDKDVVLPIKQSSYTISQLFENDNISAKFENGYCLVFRLCVNHYHRYCYLDNANKEKNVFIKGTLHTVRPIALARYPVFIRNCREYTIMHTENFGDVAQIEVGAMLVGKIKNNDNEASVKRGDEKGMFLYGGSTIIVLVNDKNVEIDKQFFENTNNMTETPVLMGQAIGKKI